MKEKRTIKKIALLGVFGALSLVLSFLESTLLPVVPFLPPGAKLGLSNIVTTLCGALFGAPAAFYITALKALFAFLTRGMTAGLMSFSGGMLSTVGLVLLLRQQGKTVSFLGISVLCAVLHNGGQLFCAAVMTGTALLLQYGKVLLVFALLTGTLTGIMLNLLVPRIRTAVQNVL